ncbi:MAG: PaaI family thioesterase [Candidatus Hodarchaeota archaeon]
MEKETHYRKLENMYLVAPCNKYYSPTIKINEGRAEITIPISEKFFHANNATHGSVYFKAADDAAWFSANSLELDYFLFTANFTIYLLKPIISGHLKAIGKVVYKGKNNFIAESVLYNSKGDQIGRGSGSFIKTKVRLREVNTYSI